MSSWWATDNAEVFLESSLERVVEQRHLTNWQAIGNGFLLSAVVSGVLFFMLPGAGYFTPFVIVSMKAAIPLCITGALLGKYLSGTLKGIGFGATLMVFLGFWLIYKIASMLPLD